MNAQRKLSNKSADNAKSALCVIASGACIVFTFTMVIIILNLNKIESLNKQFL
jgi:hypothetical protein